jgi:2-(1,2-epoxy-1,2-dihydrophenyl)acetyl-CoA isomerase
MSSPNETVVASRSGAIATLTLNRPDALNALDDAMVDALARHVGAIASDPDVRVVVLRGAGRHFMAGGDIRVFARSLELSGEARTTAFRSLMDRVHAVIETLARMPQPVVAGVHGAVAGFGLSLANAADVVFAADDAYFASAYLQIAVTPDGGGTFHLPRIVGARKAAEIMMLGERFDAREALRIGLVNQVVARDALDAAVDAAAQRIALASTFAMQSLKRLLRGSSSRSLAEQLAAEGASFVACTARADFDEGIAALLAKRAPSFHGPG